ncbi:MAG: outer membrane lipoprotein carrier protein LolA [Deltaproteobacteria bacterium]
MIFLKVRGGEIAVVFATLLIALSIFLTTVPAVSARQISPLQGMELLRRSFSGLTDFTAEITQEKQISLLKKKIVVNGIVRFKKPDVFYMELFPPYPSRILLRDNALSLFLPAENVRNNIILSPGQSLRRWFAYLDGPATSLPDGVEVRAETRDNMTTLQITPRQKGAVKELRLTFLENGNLSRLVIEEENRDRTVLYFRSMRRNVGLTEKDFRLE